MNTLKKGYYILRYIGPRLVWLRLGVYMRKRLGITRRTFAPRPWDDIHLSGILSGGIPAGPEAYAEYKGNNPPPFLFPLGRPPDIPPSLRREPSERQPPLEERWGLLKENRCIYFGHTPSPEAVDWHKNPFDGTRGSADKVWCDIPDYLPESGDPRTMWEPTRGAWAIDIARAKPHGFDIDGADLYWQWVDSWMEANPPFMGFQWKCGQESAVRLIALALGFWSVSKQAETSPDRWVQFARLAWATGYRIENFIQYAISQKSNHAIAEACGLILISQLFPEFRSAPRWRALGRNVMERELVRTIYADGSYVQQSLNYQRMMMQEAVLALRLAELAGDPFDRGVYDLLGRCADFLLGIMDPRTGKVPQYGNNDGAWVLPLSECEFWDFRPVVQATHYLVHRRRLFEEGPWDEDLLWLFGGEALDAPPAPPTEGTSARFDAGGYYVLRARDTWAMVRCHSYVDRLYHCDPSHVDLWWQGLNILRDCGTYRYYIPGREDVERYFHSIVAHNSVEIDGSEPVTQVSRFLKFPWPKSKLRHVGETAGGPVLECDYLGYDRSPWHVLCRRTLLALGEHAWIVVDDILGSGRHRATQRWHFEDGTVEVDEEACEVKLGLAAGDVYLHVASREAAPARFEVVRGRDAPDAVQGFASTYYGERHPIPVLEVEFDASLPLRVVTALGLGQPAAISRPGEAGGEAERWGVSVGERRWTMELSASGRSAGKTLIAAEPESRP